MFAPCVLLLFILGSINADEALLSCDFNNTYCGWWNDENVGGEWEFKSDEEGADAKDIVLYNVRNDVYKTARLISPIYDRSLVEGGCFKLRFGHYLRHNIILKVYQVPESLGVTALFSSPEEQKRKYIIFHESPTPTVQRTELVFDARSMFLGYPENFQIVIEGENWWGLTSIQQYDILRGKECIEAIRHTYIKKGTTQIYFENRNNNLQTVTTSPITTTT
ncbi:uncharacterized protein LOC128199482 [Bicyclus anynana]|uniref:Uncharacterized protein LOC128199482 n=1 Tax=Bicyclus anynana TaxID=110368 RepID=A0ABM3M1E3_BICAN|nr:uncharacterized protein LOC128199482 [Bicyclus anynana]